MERPSSTITTGNAAAPSSDTSPPVPSEMPTFKKEMVWRIAFRSGTRTLEEGRVVEAGHENEAQKTSKEGEKEEGKGPAKEGEVSTCEIRVLVKGAVAVGLTDQKLSSLVIEAIKSGRATQVMNLYDDERSDQGETYQEKPVEGEEGKEGGRALKKSRANSESGMQGGQEVYRRDPPSVKHQLQHQHPQQHQQHSFIAAVGAEKRERPPNARKACCYCTLKKLACSGDLPWYVRSSEVGNTAAYLCTSLSSPFSPPLRHLDEKT